MTDEFHIYISLIYIFDVVDANFDCVQAATNHNDRNVHINEHAMNITRGHFYIYFWAIVPVPCTVYCQSIKMRIQKKNMISEFTLNSILCGVRYS